MAKSQPTSLYSSSLQVLPENQPSMRPPQQSPKPMAILLPMALYPPLSLQGRRIGPMAGWKLGLSNMANMVRQTGIIGSLAVAGWIGMLFLDAWEEAAEYTRGEWPRRCRFLNEWLSKSLSWIVAVGSCEVRLVSKLLRLHTGKQSLEKNDMVQRVNLIIQGFYNKWGRFTRILSC